MFILLCQMKLSERELSERCAVSHQERPVDKIFLFGVRRLDAALFRGGLASLWRNIYETAKEEARGWTKAPSSRRTPKGPHYGTTSSSW
jgi:hypothetical protein